MGRDPYDSLPYFRVPPVLLLKFKRNGCLKLKKENKKTAGRLKISAFSDSFFRVIFSVFPGRLSALYTS